MRQIIFLAQLDLYRALPRYERGRMPGVPRLCNMSLSSAPGFCIFWFMGSPLYFASLLMNELSAHVKNVFLGPLRTNLQTALSNSALWDVLFFWLLTTSERQARRLTCRQLIIAASSRVQIKSIHHHYLRTRQGRVVEWQEEVKADGMLINWLLSLLRVTVSNQSITTTIKS